MESSMRVIVLLAVMRFSASEEVKKNLTGTVGGNITLPDSVQEKDVGFLLYGRKNIAHVIKGEFQVFVEKYKNRLQWDRNSGLFTLTELQRNDSGSYTVDSKTGKGNRKSSYELTVYDSVPTPAVKKVSGKRCVAANPAEEKTLPVHVRTTCGDTNNSTEPRNYNILIIICVLLVVIILAAFIIKLSSIFRQGRRKSTRTINNNLNIVSAGGT